LLLFGRLERLDALAKDVPTDPVRRVVVANWHRDSTDAPASPHCSFE